MAAVFAQLGHFSSKVFLSSLLVCPEVLLQDGVSQRLRGTQHDSASLQLMFPFFVRVMMGERV